MELPNLNHGDMFYGNLLARDYVNPALFTLMDQHINSDNHSLNNYSDSLITPLLPNLNMNANISSSESSTEGNYNYPSLYSTLPMFRFDYLEDYGVNRSFIDHSSMEDDLAMEEQLRWLCSGTTPEDNHIRDKDGLLGSNLKRPNMETMEKAQVRKKQCGRINKSSSKKDPQSVSAKNRRERISERLKVLRELVPNGTKVDLVTMLEKAITYVKFLQLQVKVLATDELWQEKGGKRPECGEVNQLIDVILSFSHDDEANSSSIASKYQTLLIRRSR